MKKNSKWITNIKCVTSCYAFGIVVIIHSRSIFRQSFGTNEIDGDGDNGQWCAVSLLRNIKVIKIHRTVDYLITFLLFFDYMTSMWLGAAVARYWKVTLENSWKHSLTSCSVAVDGSYNVWMTWRATTTRLDEMSCLNFCVHYFVPISMFSFVQINLKSVN